jgi:hypothetical protein
MYDLAQFTASEMTRCGIALRKIGSGAQSMEEIANSIVRYLYEELGDRRSGERACALVRFYKTHVYSELPPALRDFARGVLGGDTPPPATKCLTLLATAGERPEWNARQTSVGHQAIPLVSPEMVARLPMISQLIKQFGLEVEAILGATSAIMVDLDQRTFNVFYVPNAVGSPNIPAQAEFVIPCGIQSVLGFGGVLPSSDLFTIILFSKTPISHDTAEMFKPLALNVKMAALPFDGEAIFV